MACRIELINEKTNKSEKVIVLDKTYKECESEVIKLNESKKQNNKFWKVTVINC